MCSYFLDIVPKVRRYKFTDIFRLIPFPSEPPAVAESDWEIETDNKLTPSVVTITGNIENPTALSTRINSHGTLVISVNVVQ